MIRSQQTQETAGHSDDVEDTAGHEDGGRQKEARGQEFKFKSLLWRAKGNSERIKGGWQLGGECSIVGRCSESTLGQECGVRDGKEGPGETEIN